MKFSQKFGWIADKFGISWQLSLPDKIKEDTNELTEKYC
jgi:predicted 3-demethylubiquinone-9 3-methyltransferase (glyoxalase superfamily)